MNKKPKNKNFKVGDIVRHNMSLYKDRFEYVDGEKRFIGRDIEKSEETLLIVGYEDKRFIVSPLGDNIFFGGRKYFSYGGFDKCFTVLVKYINDNCTSVSS